MVLSETRNNEKADHKRITIQMKPAIALLIASFFAEGQTIPIPSVPGNSCLPPGVAGPQAPSCFAGKSTSPWVYATEGATSVIVVYVAARIIKKIRKDHRSK